MTTCTRIEIVDRFPDQGHGGVLFTVTLGDEAWVMKVPRRGTGGAESASAREWIYGKFAERIGLPVTRMCIVEPDTGSHRHLAAPDLHAGQTFFTATLKLDLGPAVSSWSELADTDRAALAFWENATSVGLGEKIRPHRPRDFFQWPRSPRPTERVVMLDYESDEHLWNLATNGTAMNDEHPPLRDTLAATSGISRGVIRSAADRALSCLEGSEWTDIIEGADLFTTTDLTRLAPAMRHRIEATSSFLATWGPHRQ